MTDVIVLCYHGVSERWPAEYSIAPSVLESQLSLLVDRGYRGVTFHEAVRGGYSGRLMAITFDDAFRSVFEVAFPVLKSLGLVGTVFAPTGFVGRGEPVGWPEVEVWLGGPHQEELYPASWQQLNELAEAGWEIGSHTRTHPHLTDLSDEELEIELMESREQCQHHLGTPCRSIAYPFGDCDTRVAAAALRAGYEAAASLPRRFRSGDPMAWPRVGIYRSDGVVAYRFKVSRAVRRLRRTAVWPK